MKKRILCLLAAVAYLLAAATLLSTKIEEQMRTRVTVKICKPGRVSDVQLPESVMFFDPIPKLFTVEEGSGWDSGLRIREYTGNWEYKEADEVVMLNTLKEIPILLSASRSPRDGDLAAVVQLSACEDTYLAVFPEGVPEDAYSSETFSIIARSTNAVLISVPKASFPFMEHTASLALRDNLGENFRVYSMTEWNAFADSLPLLVLLAFAAAVPVVLWLESACFSSMCNRYRCVISLLISGLGIWGSWIILNAVNLPPSMLPADMITDFRHYASEFSIITGSLSELGPAGEIFLVSMTRAKTVSAVITAAGTALVLLEVMPLRMKRNP